MGDTLLHVSHLDLAFVGELLEESLLEVCEVLASHGPFWILFINGNDLVSGVGPDPDVILKELLFVELGQSLGKSRILVSEVFESGLLVLGQHPEGWCHGHSEEEMSLEDDSTDQSSNELVALEPVWVGHARVKDEAVTLLAGIVTTVGRADIQGQLVRHEIKLHVSEDKGRLVVLLFSVCFTVKE